MTMPHPKVISVGVAAVAASAIVAAQEVSSWLDSPTVRAVVISGAFSIVVYLLSMWERNRAQRRVDKASDEKMRAEVNARSQAAQDGIRKQYQEITQETLDSLRETITSLAQERDKLSAHATQMQTSMFGAMAEVSKLTRDNLVLEAQARTAEQARESCMATRKALEDELGVTRKLLKEAQDTITRGIIRIEKDRVEQKPKSGDVKLPVGGE